MFLYLLLSFFISACLVLGEVAALSPKGGSFYDLGCGVGKALVLAALHGAQFTRCVGRGGLENNSMSNYVKE